MLVPLAAWAAPPITTWTGNASDWNLPTNWSNGTPDATFEAVLNGGAGTPTLIGSSVTVDTLTMNGTGNTLNLQNLSLTAQTVNLSVGTITGVAGSGLNVGTMTMTGGTIASAVGIATTGTVTLTGVSLGSVISSTGGVTTNGAVTLSGSNTYSGTTTISAGTLQIGNGGGGSLGSGNVVISTGATLA
ncbi:MAG: hypothetical protein E6G95_18570, partial [Alphaproteobacteria bacterium]